MMKSILNVVALCAVIALAGCNNSNKTSANMGAVGDSKSGCCSAGKSAGCCSGDKSKASTTDANGTNMGAVSDTKSSGCTGKTSSGCPHATQSSTSGN